MWPSGQSNVQSSVTRSVAGVRASARARSPTKELFLIIYMHTMDTELMPGRGSTVKWTVQSDRPPGREFHRPAIDETWVINATPSNSTGRDCSRRIVIIRWIHRSTMQTCAQLAPPARLIPYIKLGPHQQQRRSNIVECYKSNDSFDKVETNLTCSICFDFVEMTKFRSTLLPKTPTMS